MARSGICQNFQFQIGLFLRDLVYLFSGVVYVEHVVAMITDRLYVVMHGITMHAATNNPQISNPQKLKCLSTDGKVLLCAFLS